MIPKMSSPNLGPLNVISPLQSPMGPCGPVPTPYPNIGSQPSLYCMTGLGGSPPASAPRFGMGSPATMVKGGGQSVHVNSMGSMAGSSLSPSQSKVMVSG